MLMVREHYLPVYRPRAVEFGRITMRNLVSVRLQGSLKRPLVSPRIAMSARAMNN